MNGLNSLRHGGKLGGKPSPEYQVWIDMRRRCQNPKRTGYEIYGGRGIKVCARWFLEDTGRRPTLGHTLDRKDNDGDYCPENCRWATHQEQSNNMRRNRRLTIYGITKTCADWARQFNISPKTIIGRKIKGWSDMDAVMLPLGATPDMAVVSAAFHFEGCA